MSAVAGRILLISKGDYNPNTVYNTLDWVRHDNAAWVCKEDNVQNDPPSTSSTKWALLAADSAMSNLGDLNDVVISSETGGQFLGCYVDTSTTPATITWRNLSAATTYSSTGTDPISGTGVADALGSYYTKSEIDLDNLLKYGGAKTGTELTSASMLVSANAGKYYRASEDFTTTSDYVQGAGKTVNTGHHVAVLEISTGVYKFDDMGGFVDLSAKADKTELPVQITRTGQTITAGTAIRIPASPDTDNRITTSKTIIPICDDNAGKSVKFSSLSVNTGYVEITPAETLQDTKTIGIVIM